MKTQSVAVNIEMKIYEKIVVQQILASRILNWTEVRNAKESRD